MARLQTSFTTNVRLLNLSSGGDHAALILDLPFRDMRLMMYANSKRRDPIGRATFFCLVKLPVRFWLTRLSNVYPFDLTLADFSDQRFGLIESRWNSSVNHDMDNIQVVTLLSMITT